MTVLQNAIWERVVKKHSRAIENAATIPLGSGYWLYDIHRDNFHTILDADILGAQAHAGVMVVSAVQDEELDW